MPDLSRNYLMRLDPSFQNTITTDPAPLVAPRSTINPLSLNLNPPGSLISQVKLSNYQKPSVDSNLKPKSESNIMNPLKLA